MQVAILIAVIIMIALQLWSMFMPISIPESLANSLARLTEAGAAHTNGLMRPLLGKLNAIQDFGRAQGAAEAQQQIVDLQAQIVTLQQQLADASGDPVLVAQLQEQIGALQAELTAAKEDVAEGNRNMLTASETVLDIARTLENETQGAISVIDAAAVQEDPAAPAPRA